MISAIVEQVNRLWKIWMDYFCEKHWSFGPAVLIVRVYDHSMRKRFLVVGILIAEHYLYQAPYLLIFEENANDSK